MNSKNQNAVESHLTSLPESTKDGGESLDLPRLPYSNLPRPPRSSTAQAKGKEKQKAWTLGFCISKRLSPGDLRVISGIVHFVNT